MSGSGPQPQLSFNSASNRITSGGADYAAARNVTSDGTHTYTYDALTHRARTVVGSTATEFIFNANGRGSQRWKCGCYEF